MAMVMIFAAAALAGCSTGSSESLGSGIASYDALRQANAACVARGGSVQPRKDGIPGELADYSCVIPGAK
jgi:hypothetical protein